MSKILEFGRKAMWYIRVISGYEERRIRSYRLQLEQRVRSAQQRKEAVSRIPEQMVLSEVRRMVEEMQNLNKSLEDIEADINEYFKPFDKEVESVMKMQLEKEKVTAEMMSTMYKQAMLEKAAALEASRTNEEKMQSMSSMFKQALLEKAEGEADSKDARNQAKAPSPTRQL